MRCCHVSAQTFVGIDPRHGFRLGIKCHFGGSGCSAVSWRHFGSAGHFGGNFIISAWAVAAANLILTASAATTPVFWIRIMVNVSYKTGALPRLFATFRRLSGSAIVPASMDCKQDAAQSSSQSLTHKPPCRRRTDRPIRVLLINPFLRKFSCPK